MIPTAALILAQTLTLATYNVQWAGAQTGADAWTAGRRQVAAATIRSADPDIIGLQEPTAAQLTDIDADLPGYVRAGARNPIYVRRGMLRVLAHGEVWLSPTPRVPSVAWAWGAIRERTCRWAWIEHTSGGAILVLNAHVSNRSATAQRNSIALIDALSRGTRPVLLGDLNARPASAAVAPLLAGGWTDALATEQPRGTWQDYGRLTAWGPCLDWVLARNRPVVGRVHRYRSPGGRCGSDHDLVVAVVRMGQ